MAQPPIKNNPAFLNDKELAEAFVVRHDDLDSVLDVLRENTGESNQHVLVIGPRGIGKTMLVLRIALAVRQDAELGRRWYPLSFAEESYEVGTAGEFWLEALFHLSRQTKSQAWRDTYEELKSEPVETRLRERALAQLRDFADQEGKRLLLIVENLNMLLGDQVSDDDAWKLRHTLMHDPRMMLLATATSRLQETENTGKAMFELFKCHSLRPLDDGDCQKLWQSVAGEDLGSSRIRAVKILTGGNPRLLAIISHFGARLSFAELMADMTRLVDDHTEYFKSHLDSLPATERRAYVALCELWDPSTARQVARAARQDVSKTSAQLKRLIGRGAVMDVTKRGRTKRYQVAERMYNIYYLMRRRGAPSERVKAVVQFLVHFYGNGDLLKVVRKLADEACGLAPEERLHHYYAYEWILRCANDNVSTKILACTPRQFLSAADVPDTLRRWVSDRDRDDYCPCDHSDHNDPRVRDCMARARQLVKDGESLADAEKLVREALDVDPCYADGWSTLGAIMANQEARRGDAEEAFLQATQIAPDYPCGWVALGSFLRQCGEDADGAEHAFRKAVEVYPHCADAWLMMGEQLAQRGGSDEDVRQAYEQAEKAQEHLTRTMHNRGRAWHLLGRIRHKRTQRFAEAEEAYRQAIQLCPRDARPWSSLGELLHEELHRTAEAVEALHKALELDPDDASSWAHLGAMLQTQPEQAVEAEAALRKATQIAPDYHWAWEQLGVLLASIPDGVPEAEAALQKAVELNPQCVGGLGTLALLLRDQLDRYDEAEALFRRIIDMNRSHVADAWTDLGLLLHHRRRRYQEAEEAYREAIGLDPRQQNATRNLARLLYAQMEQYEEAEGLLRAAIERGEDGVDLMWAELGHLLRTQGERHAEAEKAFRHAIEIRPEHTCPWLALISLLLREQSSPEKARYAARELLAATPAQATVLNELAWLFYQSGPVDYLGDAEEWARQAVAIDETSARKHTLACVLARSNKPGSALALTEELVSGSDFVEENIDGMVTLLGELVASGCAQQAYRLLKDSGAATSVEPALVALQMYLNDEVHVAVEIAEVAKDVLTQFEQLCIRRQRERSSGQSCADQETQGE